MQENPDHVVVHRPTQCAPCAHPLDAPGGLAAERRQVFDLVARREVTEHQVATVRCPACEGAPTAAFPSPVPAPVQYGPRLKTFLSYGSVYQLLPAERLCELVADLTGHPVSEGTRCNANDQMLARLETFEGDLKATLTEAPVVPRDESGPRVEGKPHRVHSASTPTATYDCVHRQRGVVALTAAGIWAKLTRVAVHDGGPAYGTFTPCAPARCHQHHERELRAVIDTDHQAGADDLIQHLPGIKSAVAEPPIRSRRYPPAPENGGG